MVSKCWAICTFCVYRRYWSVRSPAITMSPTDILIVGDLSRADAQLYQFQVFCSLNGSANVKSVEPLRAVEHERLTRETLDILAQGRTCVTSYELTYLQRLAKINHNEGPRRACKAARGPALRECSPMLGPSSCPIQCLRRNPLSAAQQPRHESHCYS